MSKFAKTVALGASLLAVMAPMASAEQPHVAPIKAYVESELRQKVSNARVVSAIMAQNREHARLRQSEIDSLDKQWRAEVNAGSGPLTAKLLSKDLSRYLGTVQRDSRGLITEVFVMDAKGLNVGQSTLTSDYWQGDEAKWKKTFGSGKDTIFVDEIEVDESTQALQSQVSFSIVDPDTGEIIGAVTAGINLELLDL